MVLGGQEENPISGWAAQFPSRSKGLLWDISLKKVQMAPGLGLGVAECGMEGCCRSFDPVSLIKAENREWSWVGGGRYPSRCEVGTWTGFSQGGRSVISIPEPSLLNPGICNKI